MCEERHVRNWWFRFMICQQRNSNQWWNAVYTDWWEWNGCKKLNPKMRNKELYWVATVPGRKQSGGCTFLRSLPPQTAPPCSCSGCSILGWWLGSLVCSNRGVHTSSIRGSSSASWDGWVVSVSADSWEVFLPCIWVKFCVVQGLSQLKCTTILCLHRLSLLGTLQCRIGEELLPECSVDEKEARGTKTTLTHAWQLPTMTDKSRLLTDSTNHA